MGIADILKIFLLTAMLCIAPLAPATAAGMPASAFGVDHGSHCVEPGHQETCGSEVCIAVDCCSLGTSGYVAPLPVVLSPFALQARLVHAAPLPIAQLALSPPFRPPIG